MHTKIWKLVLVLGVSALVNAETRNIRALKSTAPLDHRSSNSIADSSTSWNYDSYQNVDNSYQPAPAGGYSSGGYASGGYSNGGETSNSPVDHSSYYGNYQQSSAAAPTTSYGWDEEPATGPSYKYKYQIVPHHHGHGHKDKGHLFSKDKGHGGPGWGYPTGWGYEEDYAVDDKKEWFFKKLGTKGIIAAVVLGLLAINAIVKFALQALPVPTIAIPNAGGQQGTTVMWALTRALKHPFMEKYINDLPALKKKVESVVTDTSQAVSRTYNDFQQGQCVERFSCEFNQAAKKYSAEPVLESAMSVLIPKNMSKANTRVRKGMSAGKCSEFSCPRFF